MRSSVATSSDSRTRVLGSWNWGGAATLITTRRGAGEAIGGVQSRGGDRCWAEHGGGQSFWSSLPARAPRVVRSLLRNSASLFPTMTVSVSAVVQDSLPYRYNRYLRVSDHSPTPRTVLHMYVPPTAPLGLRLALYKCLIQKKKKKKKTRLLYTVGVPTVHPILSHIPRNPCGCRAGQRQLTVRPTCGIRSTQCGTLAHK